MLRTFAVLPGLKAADTFSASVAGNDIQIQNTVHASVQYVQISERQILFTEKWSQLQTFLLHKGCFTLLSL